MTVFEVLPIVLDAVKAAMAKANEAKTDDGKIDAGEVFEIIWAFAGAIIKLFSKEPVIK